MSVTLTELFEQSDDGVIQWQGDDVRAVISFEVSDRSRIRIRRLGSSRARAQAIKLGLNSGALRANGLSAPSVAVWSHTAPEDCEVVVEGRRAHTLEVWNAWSLDGVDNAWLGNAGIIMEPHAGGMTLRCSDGVGDPDFADLVVWIQIEH